MEQDRIAKKAEAMEGADFVCLRLEGGDPNGENKSIEELIAVVKEVGEAVTCPLVVEGCKNVEKDSELLPKVAEALQGKNVLILSAREENYKAVGAAAGLAYNQKVGAESAVDINLAKQLNVVLTQLGVQAENVVTRTRHDRLRPACTHRHRPAPVRNLFSGKIFRLCNRF